MRFHTYPSIHDNDLFREHHLLKSKVSERVKSLIAERKTIPEIREQVHAMWAVQGWPEADIEAMIKDVLPKITPISATALDQKEFDLIRFAVPNFIPEGLTILAGPPKIGKSFLCLNMALAVASGGFAVGSIPIPTTSKVLYCALEDSERQLQDRMRMLGIDGIPENLYFLPLGGFPTVLDELGWSLLEREIDAHGFKFVIVDTWQRVKMSKTGKGSNLTLYEEDYELPGKLQAFATQKGIAILVVHQGKDEDNPFHDISGLTGMQAAPNALITLRRKNGGIVCSVAGRDFESRELAMSFDKGHWQIEGDADMAFGVEKPERGRYSPVLNSDSVKDLLKKLIKGAWYLIKWWYLMPFISGLLGELPLGL